MIKNLQCISKNDFIKYTKLIFNKYEKRDIITDNFIDRFVQELKNNVVDNGLYKYHIDEIPKPPHCPSLDSYLLNKMDEKDEILIDDFINTPIFNFIQCKIKFMNLKLYSGINNIKEIENNITSYLIYRYIKVFKTCVEKIFNFKINKSSFDNFIKIRKQILNNKTYKKHDLHVFSILTRELEYVINTLKNLSEYLQKDIYQKF